MRKKKGPKLDLDSQVDILPEPNQPVFIRPTNIPDDATAELDTSNPRSLINLLPEYMKQCVAAIPASYFSLTEEELEKKAFPDGMPSEKDTRIKIAFWDEYERAQRYGEKQVDMHRVLLGNCHIAYFQNQWIRSSGRAAWLIQPPADYMLILKEIHLLCLKSLRKAATLPVHDPETGKTNTKLIEAQNKIFQHMDMRIKGAIVQRIDQRSLNVNVNQPANEATAAEAKRLLSMDEIDLRIEELQSKSKKLQAPSQVQVQLLPDTIDVDEKEKAEKGTAKRTVP